MNKAVKVTGKVLLWTVGVIVVLLLALPLWIGPVVKGVANAVTPGITGTEFCLNRFALNPYTGVLNVGDMELANPTNYSERTAVKLDDLKVDVGMLSLAGDVIHVEEITLDGLFVYASGMTGGNFQDIAKHASGGEKAEEPAAEVAPEEPQGEKKPGKKVVIDHLTLKNFKVKIGVLPAVSVPTIELTDLGKPKDENGEAGVTFEDLWNMILEKVLAAFGAVGDGLKALGGLTADGANAAADAVGEGAKAIGEGAGKAVDAIGEGAGKAVDAIKGIFGN